MSSAKLRLFCLGLNVINKITMCLSNFTSNHINHWSYKYRKTSNIRHTPLGNEIVDHSDVVGASPAGAAPTTSSFST